MPNSNGQKGYRWEKACVDLLRAVGYPARRNRERGHADLGGLTHWAIECKDDAKLSPAAMIEQAERQAANEGKPFGVVFRKRRGKGATDMDVLMSFQTWLAVVRYIEELSRVKENDE